MDFVILNPRVNQGFAVPGSAKSRPVCPDMPSAGAGPAELTRSKGSAAVVEARVTPVAVIGMACRLPGGIDSPELLWEALLRGDDPITEIPADRWDVDEHYDPEPGVPGRSVSRWGGFLDDVGGFDADFFGIGEREAAAIDPQHRLMLETAWEAVEHAGLVPSSLSGSRTGVFAGLCHDDYTLVTNDAGAMEGPYGYTCTPFSMASGRISYALGLEGPAVTVDTSCSSGLLAIHLACRSLHEGESDLALAGGCQVLLEPSVSASASAQGMLSPTGRCHAFDAAADGFVRSDGVAVVLLKRRRPDLGGDQRKRRQSGWTIGDSHHPVIGGPGRRLPGGAGGRRRGCGHRGHGRGSRHRHPGG